MATIAGYTICFLFAGDAKQITMAHPDEDFIERFLSHRFWATSNFFLAHLWNASYPCAAQALPPENGWSGRLPCAAERNGDEQDWLCLFWEGDC